MIYKVTPMLTPEVKGKPAKPPPTSTSDVEIEQTTHVAAEAPKLPRKRRKSAVYDADGHEVLITMMCLKCKSMKPLTMFGLRKMADGAIRNQPWCRTCRSGASTKKKPDHGETEHDHAESGEHPDPAPASASAETEAPAPILEPVATTPT